ncbi:MAG TPA: pilus assembly protein PilY, partial [Myxococcaceae bacterium]
DLAAKLGVASLTPDDCARLVIRWYRGADALNPDPALRGYDRPFLLHDIFHSSPISVEPPITKIFCDFSNQCTYTLFSGSTEREGSAVPTAGSDAYDRYVYEKGGRDKIVLVGSNGGMLHAFHNGKKTGFDNVTNMAEYDEGTGEELWAFIPPDMLAKLRPNIGKHAYFVDGTPMVREVWIDGAGGASADGKKQWQEYRTVAVVGTGRGGVHRFALDLTRLLGTNMDDPANIMQPDTAGDFLWMWPQPCDPLALQVGESFSNFSPRPPPIGPVALTENADNQLRALLGGSGAGAQTPWTVNGVQARERWVVALNGGYDQNMSRGRGMAVVDLHTGHTLWSFFHGDGQPRSEHLKYPIGAGLSMLDIGKGETARDSDMLFDSATVGDYGGQLWMVRMWNPGEWDAGTGRITNWFAARSFRVQNFTASGDPESMRAPFSFMTTNTIQPEDGRLRTYLGTGDKENLLDKGSVCRLSNKQACATQGCEVDTRVTVTRGGAPLWTSSANYNGYHYTDGQALLTNNSNKSCGGAQVTLTWANNPAGSCSNTHDGSIQYTCDGNATTWSCRETANTWVSIKSEVATQPYPRRFYGLWTYGKSSDGSAPRLFNDDAQATAYDDAHFTDTHLVDVTNFGSSGQVNSAAEAPANGKGWYLEYAQEDERTGGNGTLVNGCMIWGSFEPSGASGVVCPTTGTNKARLYQSHFATGRANCASGFYTASSNSWARYVEFTTVASTPEPVAQLTLAGGHLSRGVTILGAGTSNPTGGGANGPFSINVRSTNDAV